jgi:hypothetical protein
LKCCTFGLCDNIYQQDLPIDIQKQIRKSGIDVDSIGTGKNFDTLLNVIRFSTKQYFKRPKQRTEGQQDDPNEDEEGTHYKQYGQPEPIDTGCNAPTSLLIKTEESLIVDPNAKRLFKNLEFSGKG